ncbi:epidermal growth factor receptor isoform X2 [Folsomia candida]|uniref:epidermal growth factor receptor isoform X2 n=1 Tax=Folsomia candida TaxID=158441 RepID=UPI001604EA88|nr:epidermal growth factor receptor isoform X2 [Folsomia candida]
MEKVIRSNPRGMTRRRKIWVVFIHLMVLTNSGMSNANTSDQTGRMEERVCIGTQGRMSVPSNRSHHYRNLKDRYTNCTYVEGNLELTWIQDKDMDLSFLQHIREVTGYVLISHVDVQRILLPSLQVIRGRTLFRLNVHDDEFALMVTLSRMNNLELPALRDVLAGNVGIFNNYNLCHVKTINWDEIISGINSKYVYVYNYTQPERECPPCHSSCEAGCWGEGLHNCQKFSKINCSPQCHEGRCYGHEPRQCCHLSCAGGCTGPKKSDCLACKKFYDDGECKDECPSLVVYNPNSYLSERNPNGKYAYGATCVKTCPDHLLRDAGAGACVRSCPPDKEAVDGECVSCNGPCRKKCQGPPVNGIIHSGNIDNFRNCTIIEGSIAILETSFNGFQDVHPNYTFGARFAPMAPSKLEIFSTLKEITGFLNVQATHPNFTSLSYFRNLEIIGGREKADFFSSLYIVKTSLKELKLKSLNSIRSGSVTILENNDLCFAQSINWQKIMQKPMQEQVSNNNPQETCRKTGEVCSSQCSTDGCWGAEPSDCISCAKFRLADQCVPSCNATVGIYEDSPGICKQCSEQCEKTCHGPGPGNCAKCKNVSDGPFCVDVCPPMKYNVSGECKSCHTSCTDGCTGPKSTIGFSGCNSCQQAIVDENDSIEQCLGRDETCPRGYYYESVSPKESGPLKALAGKIVCRKCHQRCKLCTAYGFHTQVCQECAKYKKGEQCEDECPTDFYADEDLRECIPCADECRGCSGPGADNCIACRNYRIYPDDDAANEVNSSFICTIQCPTEHPHRIVTDDKEPYCSHHTQTPIYEENQRPAIVVGAITFVVILLVFVIIIGFSCIRYKNKEDTIKMAMQMTGYDDNEPLRPSNVKPNLSKFRTVKEEELRKGGVLGCGAFGTVFKGVWIPEAQNVKIPVAIKVLREGTGANTSKEFLDEAYIMASVEHPHLLKLLAVCLTSQLMLVTQLMPLGCLRDYVHNNRDKVGSKALLNWCTQIARGMEYLETRRLVHRDLAARNVLVQTPTFVKITDFGLAKLLDLDEDEYKAEGGKMPIKWLALECITDRVFTHKSDVWAFGVTVWELLTYGGRPYENISARDVPDLLMKGERLQQPPFCTLELYLIMLKTWVLEPDARLSFRELVEEFAKMARDPGRYLAIPGDKLMRLPSYTPQDERELIRNLSSAMDGPDIIINAEEYLQPGLTNGGAGTITSSGSTNGTIKHNGYPPASEVSWPDSPQNLHHRMQARHRYGVGRGQSTVDSRYCSDPLNMLGKDSSDGCYSEGSTKSRQAQVGDGINFKLQLDLPVDDDDYLMPSPQYNQNATAYLDVVSDPSAKGLQGEAKAGSYAALAAQRRNHYPTLVDNPEYLNNPELMSIREYANVPMSHASYAPIGLPNPRSQQLYPQPPNHFYPQAVNGKPSHAAVANNPPLNNNAQQQQPPFVISGNRPGSVGRQGSRSEEESDHEYYNELDKLQREMQPLQSNARKNETTV